MGHSHTAYAPEDVDDARRGAPAVSLQPWAAERGLAFPGPGLAGALLPVLPDYAEYQHNVCRGELVAGRFGQVAHELHEIEAHEGSIRAGGAFFGTRVTTRRGLKSFLGWSDDRPQEPFAANAAWAPTTTVVLRVPEAALLPKVVVRNAERIGADQADLGPHGLPGHRLVRSQWIDADLEAWLGGVCAPLAEVRASYVALTLDHGVLAVQRNGFLVDPAALDHLVGVAATVAGRLAADAGPAPAFAGALPAPDPASWPGFLRPQPHEAEAFARLAEATGLTPEDPLALHRAFRRLPLPGVAGAVLRGPLPGSATDGRLVVTTQGDRTAGAYRTVVLAPATAGAVTPVGGVRHEPTDTWAEVADGVALAWPRLRARGGFGSEAALANGLTTLRDLGLAEV